MNELHELLSTGLAHRLGWMLVHSLWQGAAAAGLFGLLLLAIPRSRANARYFAGCFSLLTILILCVITFAIIEPPQPAAQISSVLSEEHGRADPVGVSESPEPMALVAREMPQADPALSEKPAVPVALPADVPVPVEPWRDRAIRIGRTQLTPLLPWLAGAWLVGVAILSLWRCGGFVATYRLGRISTAAVPEQVLELVNRLAARVRVSRPVQVLRSAVLTTPAVIGHFRPVILLPVSALTGLSTQELEAIIAHELAHIRRHDYLINIVQTAAETLLFHHPAAWWISRRIRAERENCCDDMALAVCGDRLAYARALAQVQQLGTGELGLAAAASGGSLLERIRRIVTMPDQSERSSRWLAGPLSIVLAGAFVFISCRGARALRETPATQPTAATRPAGEEKLPANPFSYLPGRTLHFPTDRNVGSLQAYGPDQKGLMFNDRIGLAKGDVLIPAGRAVLLRVGNDQSDLQFLSKLAPDDVQALNLNSPDVDDADLAHVAHLAGLRSLDLSSKKITDAGFAHLAGLVNLERLSSIGGQVSDGALRSLSGMQHLKHVGLGEQVGDEGLANLAPLTSLESVTTKSKRITPRGFATLAGMPRMKTIDCDARIVNASVLANLRLEELNCRGGRETITDEMLEALATDRSLNSLRFAGPRVSGTGLKAFAGHPTLEGLDLSGTKITDGALADLARIPKLRWLSLRNTGITDAGIANLKIAPVLRDLLLDHTQITDQALFDLARMPALESLSIEGTKITDEGLTRAAADRKIRWRYLDTTGTAVTNAGLRRIPSLVSHQVVQGPNLTKARLTPGDMAPDFTVKSLDGHRISLSDFRGKVVFLHFWDGGLPAFYGGPKELKAFADQFKDESRFVMLGLNMDWELQGALDYVRYYRLDWPQGYLGQPGLSAVLKAYWGEGNNSRTYYLIAPDGRIAMAPGMMVNYEELTAAVRELLARPIAGAASSEPRLPPAATAPSAPARKRDVRFALYRVVDPDSALGLEDRELGDLKLAEEPLLTLDDLQYYLWSTHSIILKPGVMKRLPKPSVFGIPFVVTADGKRCYAGAFWGGFINSQPRTMPLIDIRPGGPTDDSVSITIWLDAGESDPRENADLRHVLESAGKLHTVEATLREAEAVLREAQQRPSLFKIVSRLMKQKAARSATTKPLAEPASGPTRQVSH